MKALSTLLLSVGLVQATVTQSPTSSTQPAAHTVVKVTGDVSFKRQGWRNFAPVRFGTILQRGDLVRFEPNASVLVVCDGFSAAITIEGPGAKPVPCDGGTATPVRWRKIPVIPTAQIDVPSKLELALVSPADAPTTVLTKTYEQNPTFTWLSVPGADSYEVKLTGPGVTWRDRVYGNDTWGAVDPPKLTAGQNYAISIVPFLKDQPLTNASIKAVQTLLSQKFEVLTRPADSDVSGVVQSLARLPLPPAVATFLTAQAMARFGLFDGAISSLLEIQTQLQEPALKRELGEIYVAQSSFTQASTALSEAADLYSRDGDVLGRALAVEALANIEAKNASGLNKALGDFQTARDIYDRLGDKENVSRLDELIKAHTVLVKTKP